MSIGAEVSISTVAVAVWIVGPRRDSGEQHISGRAQQHDVVELWVELALVGLAAGHEKTVLVVASEQIGDGLLAPYPSDDPSGSVTQWAPPVGIGIDSPVPTRAQDP